MRTPPITRPRLGFVGIHAGNRVSQPVSQNETLAALFAASGYEVRKASAVRQPALRTLHQAVSILHWRRRIDLLVVAVFSGQSFLMADMATQLGRLIGVRSILFLHGGNLPIFGTKRRRWVERVLRRATAVLAPTEYLGKTFRDWGMTVTLVPNVLNIEQYEYIHRRNARPNLLWMRTFHDHYDPCLAVEVVARLQDRLPDVRLTMAGADQGLLETVQARARELGVEDRITFAGYIGAEAKRQVFTDNDIFLNTNLVDNMPVSVLEAAASGMLIVATEVGGIPFMFHDDVDARLVPAGDADAMAAAVIGLIDSPADAERISAGARRLAEGSAWPSVHERWKDVFVHLLDHEARS